MRTSVLFAYNSKLFLQTEKWSLKTFHVYNSKKVQTLLDPFPVEFVLLQQVFN